jgi:hypothetical protein
VLPVRIREAQVAGDVTAISESSQYLNFNVEATLIGAHTYTHSGSFFAEYSGIGKAHALPKFRPIATSIDVVGA